MRLESTDEMGSVIFSCVTKDESQVAEFKRGVRTEMRESMARNGSRATSGIMGRLVQELKRARSKKCRRLRRRVQRI